MRKKITFITAMCIIASIAALLYAQNKTITIKGSDTIVILAQRWAENFMAQHPEIVIQVTGGGSGTGISALINGTTDICNASRPMKKSEREKLKQKHNSTGIEIKAAKDGIALYVQESNPIEELTLDQIKAIYLGTITNWNKVGGPDAKIILYGRENSSGTHVYFRDFVLGGKDYSSLMQTLPGTAAVVNAVSKDKYGIGYGGAAYGKGIKFLRVKKDLSTPGYVPNIETIKAGQYPITRYLYMYIKGRPTGVLKDYIDYTLSEEGQKTVSEVGYFPVR